MRRLLLPEHHCKCGKLLFKGVLILSRVEIKCRNCGEMCGIGEWYEELSSDQYAILAAINAEDIYKEDPSPYIIDGTDSLFTTLGFAREELIGREVRSLDPLMASGAYGNLWKLLVARNFQPFSLEVYQPKKDGTFVKARGRTIFQHTKELTYLLTIFDPIGPVLCVPDRLPLPSKVNIEKIFCPFLLELDCESICDTVNYEFASILGYFITDIVNQSFLNLYPKNIRRKRRKLISLMLKNHHSFRIPGDVFERKDGARCMFDSYFTAHYTDHGVFIGLAVALWPA